MGISLSTTPTISHFFDQFFMQAFRQTHPTGCTKGIKTAPISSFLKKRISDWWDGGCWNQPAVLRQGHDLFPEGMGKSTD